LGGRLHLNEDWHVHSTFSDGVDSLEANVASAAARGIIRLGCVDHVRTDTTYVPEFVSSVRALQATTDIVLTAGVEAKLLDRAGTLDLPTSTAGVDFVYIADHQFPGDDGPVSPRVIREALAQGGEQASVVVRQLAAATMASMRSYAPQHRLVLAHLFSILPKLGLDERAIPESLLDELASCARATDTIVEISERWRCPSERTLRVCMRRGVTIVASTDSHRATDIGGYAYVAEAFAALADGATPDA
jgi:putative hydrolase